MTAKTNGLGRSSLFMRILHIYKDYYPVVGGIENHVRLLAEAQVKQGFDVTVLVTNLAPRTIVVNMEGVRVIRAGRLAHVASTPLSLDFFAQVRRLRADIAHLHFPYPPGELANLLFQPGRRTVITYHSDVIRQQGILHLYRPLLRRVLQRADRIIATSAPYIESSPFLCEVAGKCSVVPLGIDPAPFLPPDDRSTSIHTRFQPAPDRHATPVQRQTTETTDPASSQTAAVADRAAYQARPLILFVGRLRYYKGLEYLLEAMCDLDATLWIIGTGPMATEWQTLSRNWGLQNRVHFLGAVADEDLPAYYQAADVFVLPASHRSEAFGVVQLEAMAAGKPVVSTELGTGTSFVNQDGVTGFVVPPRNPATLAQAINRLLADPELRQSMGERGQQRVLEHFTVDHLIDGVINIYKSVLAQC